jgi:hypothetical protein
MAGELFINGRLVDIDQDAPFPLTFSISDIKDLSSRKGNKSKTITLPGTRGNVQLMLSVFTLSAIDSIFDDQPELIDFDPSIKAECQYYQNGLLEFNGVAQLMSCKQLSGVWSFDITLVSDTIDYISRLQKIKVNELGWSEYDHLLTYSDQQDTWSGIIELNGSPSSNYDSQGWTGTGYYYGLIDYGFTRPTADSFAVENIPPQVFCYEVLKKAFEYCGISWDSNFLETQTFKKLLLAYDGGELPIIDSSQANNDSLFTTEDNNANGYIFNGQFSDFLEPGDPTGNMSTQVRNFLDQYDCTVTQDNLSQAQGTSPLSFVSASDGLFKINYYGDHDVDIAISGNGSGAFTINGSYQVRLEIIKNGAYLTSDLIYEGALTSISTSLSFSFNYSREINTLINDEIRVNLRFVVNNTTIIRSGISNYTISFQVTSNTAQLDVLKQQQGLTAGGTVALAPFLPNMTCDVFFKAFVSAFNLYVKPSIQDATILEIEPLNDFYNASGDALDWSSKIDRSQEIMVEPTINFASKNYKFNFTQDTDYWNQRYQNDVNKQYGSFLIESQSQFSVNSTDFLLPFSQKLLVQIPGDSPGTFTDLIVPRSFDLKTNENGTSEIVLKKGKSFIVQLGGLRTGDWIHLDENDSPHNETSYPYVGHLDSLDSPSFDFNWGVPDYVFWVTNNYPSNNLYLYHDTFIKELLSRYGKKLTCYVMLNPQDINSLNFRNLINIDGVVYRLLSISDYLSGSNVSTKVELLRIIKGEGIQQTIIIDPNTRITEDGLVRITEDSLIRFIE